MNKKSTLSAWIIAAMMAMAPVGVTAQTYSSTASTQVFDLSKLGDQTLLEHFAELLITARNILLMPTLPHGVSKTR